MTVIGREYCSISKKFVSTLQTIAFRDLEFGVWMMEMSEYCRTFSRDWLPKLKNLKKIVIIVGDDDDLDDYT